MSNQLESRLAGRVVLITGGSRGIGLATARSLLARGAKVAIGDVEPEHAQELAERNGDRVLLGSLDVTDERSFAAFIALAEERLGAVDVLVNNAGIMPLGHFHEQDEAVAERTLAVNVAGVLRGMRLVLPAMLARRRGHIVNVASVAGKAPAPGGLTYSATKFAVVGATETARVEYRGSGIEFTCVMPSFTNTELIMGTAGTKFVKTIEAKDVAEAIATAVEKPRDDVFVPWSVGRIVWSYPLIGRRIRDAVGRALGADRVFLEVDKTARASYDKRAGLGSAPAPPAEDPTPAGAARGGSDAA